MSKKKIPVQRKKKDPTKKRFNQLAQFVLFMFSVLFCFVLLNIANLKNKDIEKEIVAYHVIGATDEAVTTVLNVPYEKNTLVSAEEIESQIESYETSKDSDNMPATTVVFSDIEYTSETSESVSEEIQSQDLGRELIPSEESPSEEIDFEPLEEESFSDGFEEDTLFSTYYGILDSNVCEECKEVLSDIYDPYELENMQFTHDYIMTDYSDIVLSDEDINIICNVIYHEAGLECFAGKVCIANIILNRIKSESFKFNSVTGLICEEGQFNPEYAYIDHDNFVPEEDCYEALMVALDGYDYSEGTVYYCRLDALPEGSVKDWFLSLEKCKDVGHHSFYFEEKWD